MKLSIIIPAFNEQAFIGGCLESIIQNSAGYDLEIIVVNNNSTDQTHAAASKHQGVTVIDEPIKGTNQARQTGFEHSTGDLIANIDADNRITKEWLNKVFKEFSSNPRLVGLSGPYVFYDSPNYWRFFVRLYFWLAYPIYVLGNSLFRRGGAVMGGNVVILREALQQIGGYNTDLKFYGDDSDTAARLNKVGLVKFDYGFQINSSARRLTGHGALRMLYRYGINYLWITLFHRPFNNDYEEIIAQHEHKKP